MRLLKASIRRSSDRGLGGRGNHLTTPAGGRAEPGTGHRGAVPFAGGRVRWGVVRSIAVLYRTLDEDGEKMCRGVCYGDMKEEEEFESGRKEAAT